MSLVTWSLTRQKEGWNSKKTWLSEQNWETLRRFLVIKGTWRTLLRIKEWERWGEEQKIFANVFDEDAFTVSHLDFLIAIVVCSIRKIMEVICHMIGSTWIEIPVFVIVAVLGSDEHGFNRSLFNQDFLLSVSKIHIVLGLRGGCRVVGNWPLIFTIKPVVALNDSVTYSATELTLRSIVVGSAIASTSATRTIVVSPSPIVVLRAVGLRAPIWCFLVIDIISGSIKIGSFLQNSSSWDKRRVLTCWRV